MYFFIGVVLEVLVLLIFVIFHQFHCVFIGQLLATVFWALAVRNYAPRLLGKAFWFTFVFFILLTVGLLVGTLAQTNAAPEASIEEDEFTHKKSLPPLAFGDPWAAGRWTRYARISIYRGLQWPPIEFDLLTLGTFARLSSLQNSLGLPWRR
eukprot:g10738.t1